MRMVSRMVKCNPRDSNEYRFVNARRFSNFSKPRVKPLARNGAFKSASQASVRYPLRRATYFKGQHTSYTKSSEVIGLLRGGQRAMPPKKIFRRYSHFVLWEAFFQTK